MKINHADLEAVAVKRSQYPEPTLKEIAFVGRSNVGKSSLLNLLTGRKNLARVSGNPGKTRTINFYNIDGKFRIVDLPGYGYAKISKAESEKWGPMMEEFFQLRDNLVQVVQLVDSRHAPSNQDVQMYEYLKAYGLDGLVVATKSDKLSKNEINKNKSLIRKTLGMGTDDRIIMCSALKRTGQDQLLECFDRILED